MNNNYNTFNDETCYCKECGCDYDINNNNEYGYMNCCLQCGENKYEEYLEEQELKKRKEINFNDLPSDLMTKIMNINKVVDKQEKLNKKVITHINNINQILDNNFEGQSDLCVEFPVGYQHDSRSRLQEIPRSHHGVYMREIKEFFSPKNLEDAGYDLEYVDYA